MTAPADGSRGLVVTLLLMAVTPAICEEALFRGPILRGLAAQLSPRAAALATGMLFGLFHFDVWRMLPTGLLGVVLSLIALRAGSIVPAMAAHFVNNACLVTLAQLHLDERDGRSWPRRGGRDVRRGLAAAERGRLAPAQQRGSRAAPR